MNKVSLGEWMINNLGDDAIEVYWSDKNEINPWEIARGSEKTIWIKCINIDYHDDYETNPYIFSIGCRCTYCSRNKIHPNDSFAQFYINIHGDDFLDKYWSDKNTLSPWEITKSSTKDQVYIKCQETDYHEDYLTYTNNFKIGRKCPSCSGRIVHPLDSFAQWGINKYGENFLELYWDYEKNKECNPWSLSKGNDKKVYIKCQEKDYHESYLVRVQKFVNRGDGCSYCVNKKLHRNDSLGLVFPEVLAIWSNKNTDSPFDFPPSVNHIATWKCENGKHEDYERAICASNRSDFKCPKCLRERKESKLQEKVRLFLTNEHGYAVKHEYGCDLKCINPKTKNILPYDNEVIISNNVRLIIEVHGEQHYKK
jgi:hypothetical protein